MKQKLRKGMAVIYHRFYSKLYGLVYYLFGEAESILCIVKQGS